MCLVYRKVIYQFNTPWKLTTYFMAANILSPISVSLAPKLALLDAKTDGNSSGSSLKDLL